eukprot:13280377-Heterocapsa_arctica.AAC.1
MSTEPGHQSALLDWVSTKICRVVKSTLAAEACGCSAGYDRAVYIRAIITEMMGFTAPTWEELVMRIPQ